MQQYVLKNSVSETTKMYLHGISEACTSQKIHAYATHLKISELLYTHTHFHTTKNLLFFHPRRRRGKAAISSNDLINMQLTLMSHALIM